MKRIKSHLTFFCILCLSFFSSFTVNCPDEEILFTKAMTIQYAETIQDCEGIVTTAEFIGLGNGGYKIPSKVKADVVFRCTAPGVNAQKNPLSGESVGNFCFIDPKNSSTESIYTLKNGDKLLLKGKVYVSNNFGQFSTWAILVRDLAIENFSQP